MIEKDIRAVIVSSLFPGYLIEDIATTGATIRTLRAGSGPPLLLLHGYPQTHVIGTESPAASRNASPLFSPTSVRTGDELAEGLRLGNLARKVAICHRPATAGP